MISSFFDRLYNLERSFVGFMVPSFCMFKVQSMLIAVGMWPFLAALMIFPLYSSFVLVSISFTLPIFLLMYSYPAIMFLFILPENFAGLKPFVFFSIGNPCFFHFLNPPSSIYPFE